MEQSATSTIEFSTSPQDKERIFRVKTLNFRVAPNSTIQYQPNAPAQFAITEVNVTVFGQKRDT